MEKKKNTSRYKKQRKRYLIEERESVRRQRREMKRTRKKRKGFIASLKEVLDEQKAVRSERKKLRKQTAYIRKKIRKERTKGLKRNVIRFFERPFRKKKISGGERILRSHVRHDIWAYRRSLIVNAPSALSLQAGQFFKRQRDQLRYLRKNLRYSIAPLVNRENSKELRKDLLVIVLNSTVFFIIAFWIIYFTGQLASIITARFYNIPAILYSYITEWPLFIYSPLYTRKNLILIFGLGPFLCLLLAFLMFLVFKRSYRKQFRLKFLLIWMIFHGINMFFGAYIAGVITRSGLAYTSAWLFLSQPFDIEEIVFMILSAILLVAAGFALTRYFIMATPSERTIVPHIRFVYMVAAVVLPFFLGNMVVYFTNFPYHPLNFLLIQGFAMLMVIPTLINFNTPFNQQIKLAVPKKAMRTQWFFIVLFIGLTILIRTFIHSGLYFG